MNRERRQFTTMDKILLVAVVLVAWAGVIGFLGANIAPVEVVVGTLLILGLLAFFLRKRRS